MDPTTTRSAPLEALARAHGEHLFALGRSLLGNKADAAGAVLLTLLVAEPLVPGGVDEPAGASTGNAQPLLTAICRNICQDHVADSSGANRR